MPGLRLNDLTNTPLRLMHTKLHTNNIGTYFPDTWDAYTPCTATLLYVYNVHVKLNKSLRSSEKSIYDKF